MNDETRVLAKFAAELTYEQIPEQVRARAIDLLIDQLGVEFGCSELPWAQCILATYRRAGGKPEATVIRYGDRLPVETAAFINSTFGHSFEYDDANTLTHGHAGSELIPALMAIAEREHISGREFLTTLIAAYEIRGRLGWALAPELLLHGGPHYSTTCGPFGVAAGVSRLLRMDAKGIRDALAIAGCFSGGLAQYYAGGGTAKRIFTAIAASSGIQSAHMALGGITGPDQILEGVQGLLRIYSTEYKSHVLVAELGQKWTIEHTVFKPYCCNGAILPAIEGMHKLIRDHGLKADDIASIEVGYGKASSRQVAITDPKDVLGMQYSTAYSLALTILRGKNTPLEYTEAALADPQVRALASKIHVRLDNSLEQYYVKHRPARVKVTTLSGTVYEEFVLHVKALDRQDVENKFRAQVTPVIDVEKCNSLLSVLRDIALLDDMAKIPQLLVVPQ